MRKVILSNMVTLDGFFDGPDSKINWHNVDADFINYATEMLNSADTILFGRKTYQMMASYWPTEQGIADDPIIAGKMNGLKKYVFSQSLEKAEWNNSTVLKGDIVTEVTRLQQQPGANLVILGSGGIVSPLASAGLIDEYRIIVNPVILGTGKSHFAAVKHPLKLRFIKAVPFNSGNVILYYQP